MLPDTPSSPLTDVVSDQYQKWRYPEPIVDLPKWLEDNWQWFDPVHSHQMFWPDQGYKPDLDILIAGCGTNQAAVFAYTNPAAHVVAIDVSQTSLDHHQYLKEKYQLRNLELHLHPIEEVCTLGNDFDLIVSTGVLHHLADPIKGMRGLAACLRPEGVIAIMVYARYGRIGVEILQSVFRDLGLNQDEDSLVVVKDTIASLPQDHLIRSYVKMAPDLRYDAGLVDTFLHGRDRSYTVEDCLNLVKSVGLNFQEWFFKSPYYPPLPSVDRLSAAITILPLEQQWRVMERINTRNACHYFTACRADRPRKTYLIDFSSPEILNAIPSFRYHCGFTVDAVFRPDWRMSLDSLQIALVQRVDGLHSIRDIVTEIAGNYKETYRSPAEIVEFSKNFFQLLWLRDFLTLKIEPDSER